MFHVYSFKPQLMIMFSIHFLWLASFFLHSFSMCKLCNSIKEKAKLKKIWWEKLTNQPKWNVIFWLKHEKNWNLRNSFKYNTKIQHHDWCMSTYTYKHTSHHGHRIVFYVNKHSMLMMIMCVCCWSTSHYHYYHYTHMFIYQIL